MVSFCFFLLSVFMKIAKIAAMISIVCGAACAGVASANPVVPEVKPAKDMSEQKEFSRSGEEFTYIAEVSASPDGGINVSPSSYFTGERHVMQGKLCFKITTVGKLENRKEQGYDVQVPVTTDTKVSMPCPADVAFLSDQKS
jgi:hypothetical protein